MNDDKNGSSYFVYGSAVWVCVCVCDMKKYKYEIRKINRTQKWNKQKNYTNYILR